MADKQWKNFTVWKFTKVSLVFSLLISPICIHGNYVCNCTQYLYVIVLIANSHRTMQHSEHSCV